ncbi:MAG: UpxY family transcription antiterminator [Bacteroidota bacterium]
MDQYAPKKKAGRTKLDAEEKRWFAVYTKYKREKLVVKQLLEKGIEAYVPLQQFTRYYTRKVKTVELPLISCYIFVKINESEYVPVLETSDVVTFVKFSKELVAIPEASIQILRQITGEAQEITLSQGNIEIGKKAEIIGGRLTGLKGIVVEQKGDKNFVVQLETLGYNLHMQIPRQYLRLIQR